jgi:uncharacterized protein (DUF1684 family)
MMTAVIQSAFLFQGFSRRSPDFTDTGMGRIDAAHYLEPWAHKLSLIRDVTSAWKAFPGVFEYEVSESFGAWLRTHLSAPLAVQRAALAEMVRDFSSRGGSPLTASQYRTIRAIS